MKNAAQLERLTLPSLIENIHAINDVEDIESIKACVNDCYQWLESAFSQLKVDELVSGRAVYIDELLTHLWSLKGLSSVEDLSLVAVGGYGRAQLQPYSDIDLLILSKNKLKTKCLQVLAILKNQAFCRRAIIKLNQKLQI